METLKGAVMRKKSIALMKNFFSSSMKAITLPLLPKTAFRYGVKAMNLLCSLL